MRITKQEICGYRSRWSRWRSPVELKAEVDQLRLQIGSEDFFNQAGLDFIRDAWAAAKFGCGRGASRVRLHDDERPDFEIQFLNGKVERFEFTEAQIPGRRRGAEYEKNEPKIEMWPVDKWPNRGQIFEIVRNAAAIKKEKANKLAARGTPYPQDVGLLIYLNVLEFWNEDEIDNIATTFCHAVEPAKEAFSAVWILWHGALYDLS
jgi:hypothetical protein